MEEDPVELDKHRGMAAQTATELRRRLYDVEADQVALKQRQSDLEAFLQSAPADTWPEAAAKACYLLQLLAATAEGQDPRRRKFIQSVIDDLNRLAK
jgi:hypothetical protein